MAVAATIEEAMKDWEWLLSTDGIEIVALALGMFGIAEFIKTVNRIVIIKPTQMKIRFRDMRPSGAELKRSMQDAGFRIVELAADTAVAASDAPASRAR